MFCNYCNLRVSDMLCYIQNVMSVDKCNDIIRQCLLFYNQDEIVNARNYLLECLVDLNVSVGYHESSNNPYKNVRNMILLMKEVNKTGLLPTFVATNLRNVPLITSMLPSEWLQTIAELNEKFNNVNKEISHEYRMTIKEKSIENHGSLKDSEVPSCDTTVSNKYNGVNNVGENDDIISPANTAQLDNFVQDSSNLQHNKRTSLNRIRNKQHIFSNFTNHSTNHQSKSKFPVAINADEKTLRIAPLQLISGEDPCEYMQIYFNGCHPDYTPDMVSKCLKSHNIEVLRCKRIGSNTATTVSFKVVVKQSERMEDIFKEISYSKLQPREIKARPWILYDKYTNKTFRFKNDDANLINGHKHQISTYEENEETLDIKEERNVIYEIPLTCGASYIGETSRPLKKRLSEHRNYVRNSDKKSRIVEHMLKCEKENCKPLFDTVKILCKEEDEKERKQKEAYYIMKHNAISRQSIKLSTDLCQKFKNLSL